MPKIRSLAGISFNEIHKALANAFADYAEPWNKTVEEIQYLLERRGYEASISFGAFENGELVAFMLNGPGLWNKKRTAYDMGTGTVPEFRRRGLAEKLFNAAIPVLKTAGIEQYLLEVIRVNTKAIDLYKKQGFSIVRALDYYISVKDNLTIRNSQVKLNFREFSPDWSTLKGWWDFHPSWQNSIDSVDRKSDSFTIIGAYFSEQLAGYGVIEKHTGDIPQLAIAPAFRRQGIGTVLFTKLLEHSAISTIRVINADAGYTPFRQFMLSMGLRPGHGQYEMILEL